MHVPRKRSIQQTHGYKTRRPGLQVSLTSICQEGLRWALAEETAGTGVQQDRLPFLGGLSLVAARLTPAVAAQVAALAASLAAPLKPDEEAPEWESYQALLHVLLGQSKAKPTARYVPNRALLHPFWGPPQVLPTCGYISPDWNRPSWTPPLCCLQLGAQALISTVAASKHPEGPSRTF